MSTKIENQEISNVKEKNTKKKYSKKQDANKALTDVINEPLTEVVNETPTEVVNETLDVVVNETVTEVVNETLDVVVNETVTEVVNETFIGPINETVTEVVNEQITEPVNEESEVENVKITERRVYWHKACKNEKESTMTKMKSDDVITLTDAMITLEDAEGNKTIKPVCALTRGKRIYYLFDVTPWELKNAQRLLNEKIALKEAKKKEKETSEKK